MYNFVPINLMLIGQIIHAPLEDTLHCCVRSRDSGVLRLLAIVARTEFEKFSLDRAPNAGMNWSHHLLVQLCNLCVIDEVKFVQFRIDFRQRCQKRLVIELV
jgi:hypothetical protein